MDEPCPQVSVSLGSLSVCFPSLERGAICYLAGSRPKSIYCFVVFSLVHVDLVSVKTNRLTTTNRVRTFSRRRRARSTHNRWLVLNLERFNFGGGWNELLA